MIWFVSWLNLALTWDESLRMLKENLCQHVFIKTMASNRVITFFSSWYEFFPDYPVVVWLKDNFTGLFNLKRSKICGRKVNIHLGNFEGSFFSLFWWAYNKSLLSLRGKGFWTRVEFDGGWGESHELVWGKLYLYLLIPLARTQHFLLF